MSGTNAKEKTDWDLVTEIFQEALEHPPVDRLGIVGDRCLDHPGIYSELCDLLKAHTESAEFLAELDSRKAFLLVDDEDQPPEHAGPFRLLREIGRGGMGVVYLGERSDGEFDRRVAVKVIKRGMDSDAIKRRFLRERQILAGLEHPHIGRLYDGGVTDQGQPYFAMEYVDGLTLTDFCQSRRLSIEERLVLFEQACRAVQYAHQNLVVHRDLKPSNMLVTEDGQVKLLDFGIAKIIRDEPTPGMATTTDHSQPALTPEYASPEQLAGGAITTASDVYSLGVVLYELLSGRRPYVIAGRTSREVERGISDSKVLPPSVVISEDSRISEWGISQARLRRRLRGDLDTIVLKALRKDPDRRYASVEGLLEDLRRHAEGLPIEARPESVSYRAGKFLKRHLVGVSITVVVTILLLGSVVVSLNLAREKAQESVKARQEFVKAQQVIEFMTGLFVSADPDQTQGTEITVKELLDAGSQRIETELAGQPEVQSELMEVMGQVYLHLGLYENSENLHRSALALRRSVFGNSHPLVARSLHRTGYALRGQGRWEEAAVLLKEALDMQLRLLGPDSEELGITLYDLAWIEAKKNGNYAVAESLNRQAVSIFERSVGYKSEEVARGLYNIGWMLQQRGQYEKAGEQYRESLAMWRELVGDQHRSVAKNMSGLASVYQNLGNYEEAKRLHRKALAIRQNVLAADHPDVATSLNNLAAVLSKTGDFAGAAEYFEQACAIYRKRLGDRHPFNLACEQNLGRALAGAGRVGKGIRILRKVLEILIGQIGDEHPDIAYTHRSLGDALNLKGDYVEAELHLRKAIAIWTEHLGVENPKTAATMVRLAAVLQNRGNDGEAAVLLKKALRVLTKTLGPDHPETVEAGELLAQTD